MKRCTARKDRRQILFVFVSMRVVGQNVNTPNSSPMADNAITQGGIRGLGSPLYICGHNITLRQGWYSKFYLTSVMDVTAYASLQGIWLRIQYLRAQVPPLCETACAFQTS